MIGDRGSLHFTIPSYMKSTRGNAIAIGNPVCNGAPPFVLHPLFQNIALQRFPLALEFFLWRGLLQLVAKQLAQTLA